MNIETLQTANLLYEHLQNEQNKKDTLLSIKDELSSTEGGLKISTIRKSLYLEDISEDVMVCLLNISDLRIDKLKSKFESL